MSTIAVTPSSKITSREPSPVAASPSAAQRTALSPTAARHHPHVAKARRPLIELQADHRDADREREVRCVRQSTSLSKQESTDRQAATLDEMTSFRRIERLWIAEHADIKMQEEALGVNEFQKQRGGTGASVHSALPMSTHATPASAAAFYKFAIEAAQLFATTPAPPTSSSADSPARVAMEGSSAVYSPSSLSDPESPPPPAKRPPAASCQPAAGATAAGASVDLLKRRRHLAMVIDSHHTRGKDHAERLRQRFGLPEIPAALLLPNGAADPGALEHRVSQAARMYHVPAIRIQMKRTSSSMAGGAVVGVPPGSEATMSGRRGGGGAPTHTHRQATDASTAAAVAADSGASLSRHHDHPHQCHEEGATTVDQHAPQHSSPATTLLKSNGCAASAKYFAAPSMMMAYDARLLTVREQAGRKDLALREHDGFQLLVTVHAANMYRHGKLAELPKEGEPAASPQSRKLPAIDGQLAVGGPRRRPNNDNPKSRNTTHIAVVEAKKKEPQRSPQPAHERRLAPLESKPAAPPGEKTASAAKPVKPAAADKAVTTKPAAAPAAERVKPAEPAKSAEPTAAAPAAEPAKPAEPAAAPAAEPVKNAEPAAAPAPEPAKPAEPAAAPAAEPVKSAEPAAAPAAEPTKPAEPAAAPAADPAAAPAAAPVKSAEPAAAPAAKPADPAAAPAAEPKSAEPAAAPAAEPAKTAEPAAAHSL